MSIYGLYGWHNENMEKSCLRGKFFLSGFQGFDVFPENLLSPRQRASIKLSTVTKPKTVIMTLLLQSQLPCVTTSNRLRPGLVEGGREEDAFSSTCCKPHILSSPLLASRYQVLSQDGLSPRRMKHPSS